ncbi:unnamed protein product [Tenebrio molitor]|nr:unnamed protein product [Tenebrio molitor]
MQNMSNSTVESRSFRQLPSFYSSSLRQCNYTSHSASNLFTTINLLSQVQ